MSHCFGATKNSIAPISYIFTAKNLISGRQPRKAAPLKLARSLLYAWHPNHSGSRAQANCSKSTNF